MLNNKRALFAKEYMIDRNASQAAIRAGYSAHRANMSGHQLLTNIDVKTEIDRLMAEKTNELDWSREAILAGLAREARLDSENGGSSSSRIAAFGQLGKLTMGEYARHSHDGGMTVQWLDAAENNEDQKLLDDDASQVIENISVESDIESASDAED
jgi:phage terminase small subunit